MQLPAAHWIRPNEVSRQPKVWVFLDTEARQDRDGPIETQTWRCGVTCLDHRTQGWERWADPDWGYHRDPAMLWHWIDARTKVGQRTVVVAHNLSYDLRISQAFTWLPRFGWVLDRIRPDGEQTFCRWRNGKRTIVCVDSMSWVPGPLARLGDELAIPKGRLPRADASDAAWFDYCRRDVEILRETWLRIVRWLHDADLGVWQPTGAGQAWSAWRHRHLTDRVLVGEDPEIREMEREAVWSGRAEAWRHGRQRGGPFVEWDVESAYLRIMQSCDVPTRPIGRVPEPTAAELARWDGISCVLARVEVDTDVPVVPARGEHGIVWPVGRFQTTVWDPELRLLRDADAKVRVLEAVVYSARPALRSFAEWAFPIVRGEGDGVDPIIQRVVKHWSRALIGRFGVRYHAWEPYGDALHEGVELVTMTDARTGERSRLLTVGARTLRETGQIEGDNAVPSILGYVMSETRARLWRTMERAGLEHVLHVDTDGLVVDAAGSENLVERGHAGLRIKGEFRSCEVIAPRQLVLGGQLRAPGVPRRSRRVADRTWSGATWSRLSTELHSATPDRVVVRPRRVTLRGTDHRRRHVEGGGTEPYRWDTVGG